MVGWIASARAAKYDVEYQLKDADRCTIAASDYNSATIAITGVHETETCVVRVKAKKADGASAWTESEPASP